MFGKSVHVRKFKKLELDLNGTMNGLFPEILAKVASLKAALQTFTCQVTMMPATGGDAELRALLSACRPCQNLRWQRGHFENRRCDPSPHYQHDMCVGRGRGFGQRLLIEHWTHSRRGNKLTASDLALVDELLQQRQQVQKLFIRRVVEPALDRDAVVDLRSEA